MIGVIMNTNRKVTTFFIMSLYASFLIFSASAIADTYKLYIGDMKMLQLGKIKRVAVGNGKLLSTSILDNGSLLILAEAVGDTEMKVWLENGDLVTHQFYITKNNSNRTSAEAASALRNIPGINTRKVGKNIVIEGVTSEVTSKMIETVAAKYKDIINLTVKLNLNDIVKMIQELPNLKVTVKKLGNFAIITGSVDSNGKKALESMKAIFSEIVDLTLENKVLIEPMVYMNVQITEFNTNALDNLGINWSNSFSGPSVGVYKDFSQTGDTTVSSFFNQTATPALKGTGITAAQTANYFGIATLITSTINLAVSNGDALILASPTLSAKSGGTAKFLSGGQVPVPVPGPDGATTIEYKDYGISLDIEPKAGVTGNITAKVRTEVSSLDQAVAFNNTPGFRNRSAETEVNLRDGETLVISGLVNRDIGNDLSQIKFLGDIPILGELFKSTNFRNKRSDLVIFITPYIFDANSEENKSQLKKAADLRNEFLKTIDKDSEILD